jgi:hypothetical protein
MKATFDFFNRTSVSISEASKFAKAWRETRQPSRDAAVKRYGNGFKVTVENTHTTFQFFADGKVVTFNAKPQPRYRTPMHLDVDESKPVVGIRNGKVIYA